MMRTLAHRNQRTLGATAKVVGVGYLTGRTITVRFCPAPPNHGLVFQRTDRRGVPPLPARVSEVTSATRRTVLGHYPNQVELVEHVLAACAGLRIDNCLIELDGPELPGLDGSAAEFVFALAEAPLEIQRETRPMVAAMRPIVVSDGKATLTLYPTEVPELTLTYLLDYGAHTFLGRQRHTMTLTPMSFANGIARCRTFLLEEEAVALRRQGLGTAATLNDLLVLGPKGPLGNALRFADEPARHKVLDMVGDLALLGCDLAGHVVGCKSGHALNTLLVRELTHGLRPCQPLPLRLAA